MTDIVKMMNDVSSMYADGVKELDDGTFQCPVCEKVYKRAKSAEKHVEKEDCFKMQDVFSGTLYELQAYEFFQSIMAETNPNARVTFNTFTKSKSYGPVIRFILFTNMHEVKDKGLYYSWLNEIKGFKFMNKILAEGIKESSLREHRIFLLQNEQFIDSDTFVQKYEQDLIDDEAFFTRSIEKGHVGIEYLSSHKTFPFDDVCASLSLGYWHRLETVLSQL